jgi:hypothetical protein
VHRVASAPSPLRKNVGRRAPVTPGSPTASAKCEVAIPPVRTSFALSHDNARTGLGGVSESRVSLTYCLRKGERVRPRSGTVLLFPLMVAGHFKTKCGELDGFIGSKDLSETRNQIRSAMCLTARVFKLVSTGGGAVLAEIGRPLNSMERS